MRVLRMILFTLGGFALGVVAGLAAISLLSANTHDRSVEAAMTAFFVAGPAGALVGLAVGLIRRKRL